jgi:steroid delta-isomerase-like uncharacterized protein
MAADENIAVVRRFFEEFCNGRKAELAEELLTPDHIYHDPQVPNVVGPRAMAEAVAVFQNGLDGHWGVEEVISAEGDRVVARWTGTGTHNADLQGIPPTGKPVRVSALHLFRLESGQIAEQWCVWDTLGMLQQLGVAPAPGQ